MVAPLKTHEPTLRYTRGAIWLHWIIAVFVVFNLLSGLFRESLGKEYLPTLMNLHKPIGFTILVLTIVRIGWRMLHPAPAQDAALKRWEALLARCVHALFYVLLLIIPMSGWLVVSSGRWPTTSYFGIFDIGGLPVANDPVTHTTFENLHLTLGLGMVALLALHVIGALKHQLQGHRILQRITVPATRQ